MLVPKPEDALHKAWLYRILQEIADDSFLVSVLRFKGGTCASMLKILDRFSVDLDFDLIDASQKHLVEKNLEALFRKLGISIHDRSRLVPQYFLKYAGKEGQRNTIRLDVTFPPPVENEYEAQQFSEIDRVLFCQNVPTMFANKMVAVMDRYQQHGSLAGRDLFDLHTFFSNGFSFKAGIIEERMKMPVLDYLKRLRQFIEEKFSQQLIDQDINTLLPVDVFKKLRKFLKTELLGFLDDEIVRQSLKK